MTETLAGFDPTRDLRHRETVAARDCADWLAFLEVGGKSPRTLEDYERTVAVLLRMFPQKALAEFTDGDLVHVLRQFPAGSRRKCRSHLASFFGWAHKKARRIPENPIDYLPDIGPTPKRIVPTFSEAEVELLTSLPSPDGNRDSRVTKPLQSQEIKATSGFEPLKESLLVRKSIQSGVPQG